MNLFAENNVSLCSHAKIARPQTLRPISGSAIEAQRQWSSKGPFERGTCVSFEALAATKAISTELFGGGLNKSIF